MCPRVVTCCKSCSSCLLCVHVDFATKNFGIRQYLGKINFGIRQYLDEINFGIRDLPCDSDRFQLDYVLLSRRHFHTTLSAN